MQGHADNFAQPPFQPAASSDFCRGQMKIASPEARCRHRDLDTSGRSRLRSTISPASQRPSQRHPFISGAEMKRGEWCRPDCIAARPTDVRCRAKSAFSCADVRAKEQANLRKGLCVALLHVCASLAASCLLPPRMRRSEEHRPGRSAFSLGFHAGFVWLAGFGSHGSRGLPI